MRNSFQKILGLALVICLSTTGCKMLTSNGDDFVSNDATTGPEAPQNTPNPGITETGGLPDTPPPPPPATVEILKVLSTSPANGAINIPTSMMIMVMFDKTLDSVTVTSTSFSVKDGASNPVSGTFGVIGSSATFTPSAALTENTTYTVALDGIRDTNGHGLDAPTTFSFTTKFALIPNPPFDSVNPRVICPGKTNEDFLIDRVKFHFYTGRRDNGGTDQPVFVAPMGGDVSRSTYTVITPGDSKQFGWTQEGKTNEAVLSFNSTADLTSRDFSKMAISLPSNNLPGSNDPWFLGGLFVEGLKRGCRADQKESWTPLYFNPFLRTWIAKDRPLIVSQDDAMAIFRVEVARTDDAGSDDITIHVATPFELKNIPTNGIQETPNLDYGDTDDFGNGRTYYYGRTYFAENQAWAVEPNSRLKGRISDLTRDDVSKGFKIVASGGHDGVAFQHFYAFLIKTIFRNDDIWAAHDPFVGYQGVKSVFSVDVPSPSEQTFSATLNFAARLYYLGEDISDRSALGFFKWGTEQDDPDEGNTICGGWGC